MSDLADAVVAELSARYSAKHKPNPAWDRKAEKAAWAGGREYDVPEYVDREPEEMALDCCMVVEFREDGPIMRPLSYREIAEVVAAVEASSGEQRSWR